MAKIALIVQELEAEVILLAEGLLQQRHQVRILTSAKSRRDFKTSVEIMYAFSSWSMLEGFRAIPHLLRDLPEVFHFFKSSDESFRPAEIVLMNMSRSLRRKNVCVFKGSPEQSWKLLWPLQLIDGICFEKREILMNFKRLDLIPKKAKLHVILPLSNAVPHQINPELEQFLAEIEPYIFIPGPASETNLKFMRAAVAGTPYRLLFAGARSTSSSDYLTLEKTTATDLRQIFAKAKTIQLAAHEYGIAELLQFRDWSLEHRIPMWARQDQVDSVPGLLAGGRTGWVTNMDTTDFAHSLSRVQNFVFQEDDKKNLPTGLHQDQILNSWNRLYSEIMY